MSSSLSPPLTSGISPSVAPAERLQTQTALQSLFYHHFHITQNPPSTAISPGRHYGQLVSLSDASELNSEGSADKKRSWECTRSSFMLESQSAALVSLSVLISVCLFQSVSLHLSFLVRLIISVFFSFFSSSRCDFTSPLLLLLLSFQSSSD